MKRFFKTTAYLFVTACMFISCDNAPQMPKPSTYLRLNIEKPNYIKFQDNDFPFYFQYPDYAKIEKLDSKNKDIKWFNLRFENYNFVANVSFLPLKDRKSLHASIEDCYNFLKRHEKLSGGIVEQSYANYGKKVYGNVFDIKGKDVVSPYQFYLTDSTRYFIRVALNSNFVPNNDSCEVVITQLKKDLTNMINTFQWR